MRPAVTLGITGSIAAYKSAELVRELIRRELDVSVVMTESACRFVAPLTFEALTGRKVGTSLWDDPLAHIDLARAGVVVVAPATANILSKAALGLADDLLSTLLVAAGERIVFAPAMNWRMYSNPVIRGHVESLCARGCTVVPPESGSLACGEEGEGRLADIRDIVLHVERRLRPQDFSGHRVLITSGPTREPLDPVRFISNRSSGKMGLALAREAWLRGAEVVLVTGPSSESVSPVFMARHVETASEMHRAVMEYVGGVSLAVFVAAVADFAPVKVDSIKRPKSERLEPLTLSPTPDILADVCSLANRPFVVGFAAETGPGVPAAVEKMKRKRADMMVFNDVSDPMAGFEKDTNAVSIVDTDFSVTTLPPMSKQAVAGQVLDRILSRMR